MLDLLNKRLTKSKITNVSAVLGTQDDPRLPLDALDLVLMVDVYHELSQPQLMLRHIRASLKPGGRLVLLEYRKEDPEHPDQAGTQDVGGRCQAGSRGRGIQADEDQRGSTPPAHPDLHEVVDGVEARGSRLEAAEARSCVSKENLYVPSASQPCPPLRLEIYSDDASR